MTNSRDTLLDTLDAIIARMTIDAAKLRADDFSDDDTDTMPARARIALAMIESLANIDSTPNECLAELLADDNFTDDIMLSDMLLPIK